MLPLDRDLLLWGWLVGRGDPVHGSSEAREDLNDTGRMLGLREQLFQQVGRPDLHGEQGPVDPSCLRLGIRQGSAGQG